LANHQSAIKRARQNIVRQQRNKSVKTRTKNAVKSVRSAVVEKDTATATEKLKMATSLLHKAAKKGVIHQNTASRKISRLSKLVDTLAG
jgi:small subunit ribosomal protein S20